MEGRQTLDSVIIANKCIEGRRISDRNDLLCKLDMEKAYDHVNWDFLDYILSIMRFGAKWRNWIFYCIRSVNCSVLVNGCPTSYFRSFRGLRQGDPLSPLLFIIVSKVLSRMIKRAEDVYLPGFVVGRGVVESLMFADDTMIFCDASETQVSILRCILCCFEAVSGFKINLGKSELFMVGMVSNIESLAWILGCKIGVMPYRYLGMLLGISFE